MRWQLKVRPLTIYTAGAARQWSGSFSENSRNVSFAGVCSNNNSRKVSFGGRERVTGVSGARGGTGGSASRPAVAGEGRRKIGGEGGSEGEGDGKWEMESGSASRSAVTGEGRRKKGGEGGSEGEGEGKWDGREGGGGSSPPQTHILFPYPFMLVQ